MPLLVESKAFKPMLQVIDLLKANDFTHDDKLVAGGDFLIRKIKMNKVTVIRQEIGQQSVLSFGNSSGDGVTYKGKAE